MKKRILTLAVSAAILSSATQVQAAGFQLAEYSATGLGRAYAGEAAMADNASSQSRNPALLSALQGRQVSAGAIYLTPEVDVDGTNTFLLSGAQIDASAKDVADDAFIPNFYYSSQINDKWTWGLALNSNYGLKTEIPADHSAAIYGSATSITTYELNPNIAYRITDAISVGAGLRIVYGEGEVTATVPTWLSQATPYPAGTPLKTMEGDDTAFGWKLGASWQVNPDHKVGLAYHSGVEFDLEGAVGGLKYVGTQPITVDGVLPLELPAFAELSSFNQVTDKLALHTSINWTQWSVFKELRANFPGETKPIGGISTDLVKEENFKDNWRFALGATYQVSDAWALRSGIALDQTAVEDEYRTTTIPDADRLWYSLGASYVASSNMSVDMSLTYITYHGDAPITEIEPSAGVRLDAQASGNVWLAGVQLNYKF